MPTARPSISASTGAVLVSETTLLTAKSPAMPAATPISAFSMVMPAATSEPNVTTRTTRAIATPMASVPPTSGSEFITSPPCSTRSPAASAAAPLCSYSVRCTSLTASARSTNCTWISAYRPSGESARTAYGSTAPTTPGSADASLTRPWTACLSTGSASVPPAGAATTMVPVAPLASGNSVRRASIARCDSVPGMVKLLDVGPLNSRALPPSSVSSTSHRATTSLRRRNEARPSRYNRVAMSVLGSRGEQGTPRHVGEDGTQKRVVGVADGDRADAREHDLGGDAVGGIGGAGGDRRAEVLDQRPQLGERRRRQHLDRAAVDEPRLAAVAQHQVDEAVDRRVAGGLAVEEGEAGVQLGQFERGGGDQGGEDRLLAVEVIQQRRLRATYLRRDVLQGGSLEPEAGEERGGGDDDLVARTGTDHA